MENMQHHIIRFKNHSHFGLNMNDDDHVAIIDPGVDKELASRLFNHPAQEWHCWVTRQWNQDGYGLSFRVLFLRVLPPPPKHKQPLLTTTVWVNWAQFTTSKQVPRHHVYKQSRLTTHQPHYVSTHLKRLLELTFQGLMITTVPPPPPKQHKQPLCVSYSSNHNWNTTFRTRWLPRSSPHSTNQRFTQNPCVA